MAARYSEIEEYIMDKIHTGEWPVGYMIGTGGTSQACETQGNVRDGPPCSGGHYGIY